MSVESMLIAREMGDNSGLSLELTKYDMGDDEKRTSCSRKTGYESAVGDLDKMIKVLCPARRISSFLCDPRGEKMGKTVESLQAYINVRDNYISLLREKEGK